MPVADRLARSRAVPSLVGGVLSLQLVVAAGAVAGPFALTPTTAGGTPQPVSVPAAAAVADRGRPAGPAILTAPQLWSGAVAATPLGLRRDGALQVPTRAGALGWWAGGVRPGEPGASVVVGHVDLDGRPGVFARLAGARPGMRVSVNRGGAVVTYRVVEVAQYAKTAFPTERVYRPSAATELRLVTCGGRFDRRTGHYTDNVVVRAVRV